MAHQAEQTCIRYAGDPASSASRTAVSKSRRRTETRTAALRNSTRAGAAAMPAISVARAASASPAGFLCRGQTFASRRDCRLGGNRLGEAGDRIRRTLEFQHQDAEQRLGRRIAAVEDHRFRGIRHRTFRVIHLHAEIGPALAQAGIRATAPRPRPVLDCGCRAAFGHAARAESSAASRECGARRSSADSRAGRPETAHQSAPRRAQSTRSNWQWFAVSPCGLLLSQPLRSDRGGRIPTAATRARGYAQGQPFPDRPAAMFSLMAIRKSKSGRLADPSRAARPGRPRRSRRADPAAGRSADRASDRDRQPQAAIVGDRLHARQRSAIDAPPSMRRWHDGTHRLPARAGCDGWPRSHRRGPLGSCGHGCLLIPLWCGIAWWSARLVPASGVRPSTESS